MDRCTHLCLTYRVCEDAQEEEERGSRPDPQEREKEERNVQTRIPRKNKDGLETWLFFVNPFSSCRLVDRGRRLHDKRGEQVPQTDACLWVRLSGKLSTDIVQIHPVSWTGGVEVVRTCSARLVLPPAARLRT